MSPLVIMVQTPFQSLVARYHEDHDGLVHCFSCNPIAFPVRSSETKHSDDDQPKGYSDNPRPYFLHVASSQIPSRKMGQVMQ